MKNLILLFFLAFPLFCQTGSQPSYADCNIPFRTAAAGSIRTPSNGYNAGSLQTGCVGWILEYYNSGYSPVSVELDFSDDSAGFPASWAAAATVVTATGCSTSQPLSSTGHGCVIVSGAAPWVSVAVTVTGSGTLTGNAFGCRPDHCAAFFASSGGGGGGTFSSACNLQVEKALSGTGYIQIVAGSGSEVIHVCNVVYGSASSGTPVVNTFSLAFGTCASTPTQILTLPGITGYTDNFFGSLAGAAGAALCAEESTANSDIVTVTYYQQ